jgi:hypothetical protein
MEREAHTKELSTLRSYKLTAEVELIELRQQVDAAASYESLIESLTEKNLDLSHRTSELELTVRDLEEQQELTEELDQRQRQEMDIARKQLDSANILALEKSKIIWYAITYDWPIVLCPSVPLLVAFSHRYCISAMIIGFS